MRQLSSLLFAFSVLAAAESASAQVGRRVTLVQRVKVVAVAPVVVRILTLPPTRAVTPPRSTPVPAPAPTRPKESPCDFARRMRKDYDEHSKLDPRSFPEAAPGVVPTG
jgi:hypothetical protein